MIWPDMLWDVRVEPLLVFGVVGLVIIGAGLYKLSRFLRRYPKPPSVEAPVHGR